MTRKVATLTLTELFQEQYREDPNATLGSARADLQALHESAPGDSAAQPEHLLVEIDELIHSHGERCPLADLLPQPVSGDGGSPGTHG